MCFWGSGVSRVSEGVAFLMFLMFLRVLVLLGFLVFLMFLRIFVLLGFLVFLMSLAFWGFIVFLVFPRVLVPDPCVSEGFRVSDISPMARVQVSLAGIPGHMYSTQ